MGCTKMGHMHQWPTSGSLVIQRCEVRCNFCEGPAAKKDWKYAWFLRRHVRAMHVKKGQYPRLRVECTWDEKNLRGPGRAGVKKEEESDDEDDEPPTFISQPIYEEQRDQGMVYPSFINPSDLNGADADFDFNDYHPFPVFGTEDPHYGGQNENYTAVHFHDFLDDATGGHGNVQPQLDADGLPIVNDNNNLPEAADELYDDSDEYTWHDEVDEYMRFFAPAYREKSPQPIEKSSKPTQSLPKPVDSYPVERLPEQSFNEIMAAGTKIDDNMRSRIVAHFNMACDEIAEQGIDPKQLLTCIGDMARILYKVSETDIKPTIDAEGWALQQNPMTY